MAFFEILKFVNLFFKFFFEIKGLVFMLQQMEEDKKINEQQQLRSELKNAKTNEERAALARKLGGFGP